MRASEALNENLYRRLLRLFGAVRVCNVGEAAVPPRGELVTEHGQLRLAFAHKGEQYMASCPFCADTRFRLYFHHLYGTQDVSGRRLRFLACCFNEGCLSDYQHECALWEMMECDDARLTSGRVKEGVVVDPEHREVMLPGPCERIDRLPPGHDAVQYLRGRGFDTGVLGRYYGVCYCARSQYYGARKRVIIPVFAGRRLASWQARYVGELPWKDPDRKRGLPPKYFSCPASSLRTHALYNIDNARHYATGIICEGPADVWALGPMAVCGFGNNLTPWQRERFLTAFRRRTGVLLYDPGTYGSEANEFIVDCMRTAMGPRNFCEVRLPDGVDPGSCSGRRAWLRDYVRDQAARQGVAVTYARAAVQPAGAP